MFTQQAFNHIVEGMEVYDRDGNLIGTVEDYRVGEGTIKAAETDTITTAEIISDALGGHKDLPTVLYGRLYDKGFVRINRGFLRKDMLILPEQIEHINEVSLHLNVNDSELIKI